MARPYPPQNTSQSCLKTLFIAIGVAVSIFVVLVLVVFVAVKYTPSDKTYLVNTREETVRKGWVSGVDDCPSSPEYGELVAPVAGFYKTPDVGLNRHGVIPHGSKVELLTTFDPSGMVKIRYEGREGYVQGIMLVSYDPREGVKPNPETCG